jgi:DnaJ homolog subfamily A member 2
MFGDFNFEGMRN